MRKMEDSMRLIKLALNGQRRAILASLFLSGLLFLMLAPVLLAEETAVEAVLTVAKNVDKGEASPSSLLQYSIVISYTGPFTPVNVVDTLPLGLAYQPDSLAVSGGGSYGQSGGVITWTGAVNSGAPVTISFSGILDGGLNAGDLITNTVEATATETDELLTSSAVTLIAAEPVTKTVFLPLVARSLPAVTLHAISRPTSSNQWNISWTAAGAGISGYTLEESQTADFTAVTTHDIGPDTTAVQATRTPSFHNEYYYRVRAYSPGIVGPWSNVQSVVGAYRDDFNDHSSGWAIRRTTFIEKVQSWYESYNNGQDNRLILRVEDSWDWGITSPLKKAPAVPYVIEHRSEIANLGNLVSHGTVFGGDWNGQPCPDWSSVEGVYQHTNCFNHFYNANTIWYGQLKLVFERVDYLNWCPACGGSPMKRLTTDENSWFQVGLIPNVNPHGANVYRIEVRDTGLRFFANGQQYAQTSDATWVNSPYFGIFGSTDEYSNSTWRVEYFQVTPLDQ
jgi:uncharacterized repeat protein (TIGR01451 family)